MGEFHNFPFSLSFISMSVIYFLYLFSPFFRLVFWFPVRRSFGGGLFLGIQESRSMNEPIWLKFLCSKRVDIPRSSVCPAIKLL